MNPTEAVLALSRNEPVDQKILRALRRDGLVVLRDVADHDTPPGQTEYMFTRFTDKGQDLLDSVLAKK